MSIQYSYCYYLNFNHREGRTAGAQPHATSNQIHIKKLSVRKLLCTSVTPTNNSICHVPSTMQICIFYTHVSA